MSKASKFVLVIAGSLVATASAAAGEDLPNDLSRCENAEGPAALVTVRGLKSAAGFVRVQSYRATKADWLAKGRWLSRIEVPVKASTMQICVPVSQPGTYGIAVRHDVNGNGKTDIRRDGGGMSNNPKISIFNLGKPSVDKVAVRVGPGVTPIQINMRYM